MKLFKNLLTIGIFMISLLSFTFSQDVTLSLDGGNLDYLSTADVAGFQFDHDGCVTGASGGDATANGFTVSASASTVLAFSFTGSVVPAGEGTLVVLTGDVTEECLSNFIFSDSAGSPLAWGFAEVVAGCTDVSACNYNPDAVEDDASCAYEFDCAGECGGMAMLDDCGICDGNNADQDCSGVCFGDAVVDCAGECNGSASEDVCGECNGSETDPAACVEEGYSLSIGEVTDTSMEIIMNNEDLVAGFQFAISGLTGASAAGGSAEAAGFSVSVGATGTVLGFSFSGATIPAGNGLLTLITFESMDSEVCVTDVVLSDSAGLALDVEVGDCYCGLALDCAGECGGTAVEDCLGECNGDAVVDCAGVCDGDAIVDCAGDCNGDAVVDCAGECNGTAIEDVCGECNGSETDVNNCFDSNELFVHSFTPTSDTTARLDLYMSNLEPISGFEFRVTSSLDGFELGSTYGGSAADPASDFSVSTSGSGMVLGFSFSGGTIPYGYGLLTSIDVTLDSTEDMVGYIYLDDVVMADPTGTQIDFGVQPYFSIGGAPDAPMAPMNLTAEVVETINVDILWDAADGADYYTLYRNGQVIATPSTPGHFDVNLDYDTSYTYMVSAGNGAGDSGMSSSVTVTTGIEPFDPIPPSNLMAMAGDEQITLTWEAPVGPQEAVDCIGTEFDPFNAQYTGYDCLVCGLENDAGEICGDGLGEACVDWLDDGYCDDGSFGFDFTCDAFGCDCTDCGMECEDPNGHCGEPVPCTEITNLSVTGLTDIDGDGIDDPCYDAADGTSSHYFLLSWEGDCPVTDIYWGVDNPYENGGNFGSFPGPTLMFYGFGPNEAYQFVVTNSTQSPPVESEIAEGATGPEDCAADSAPCSEQPGMVDDCSGDGDCCAESWIGDGYCDDESQEFGCDLSCYEGETADCGGMMSPGSGSLQQKLAHLSQYNRVSNDYPYTVMPTSKETGELADYSYESSMNTQTREELLSYKIYMSTTAGDYAHVATAGPNDYSYTMTGLDNGTQYYFVATAVYQGFDDTQPELESGYSNIASATPVPFQAPVPQNLMASPGDNEAMLSWDSVVQEREEAFVGYNVYRSITSGSSYTFVAAITGDETMYTDSGLDNGQMYYYVVTSQYEETESSYSNEASAQPMDFIQLSMTDVEGIYAPGDTFDVTISWENPGTIAGIQLVLEDLPEAVTMTNVEGLGALAGEDLNAYSSDYNGVATILWFSLTGATLGAGEGEIARVTFQVNDDAGCGSFDLNFSDDVTGTVFSDSNGLAYFWDGEGQSINTICDANLSLVQVSETVFEVHMINTVDVAGFQFDLVDTPDNFDISTSSTTARTNGYLVSTNASGTVIGFSISGGTIAPGSGAIVQITSGSSLNDTEVCFDNIVLADPSGAEIEARSECIMFSDELANDELEIPNNFSISKIYPNPFNPSTTIEWTMKEFGSHRLDVYNTNGQLIDVISNGYTSPGYKQSTWDASNHASGIYIIRLVINNNLVSSNKVMLVK